MIFWRGLHNFCINRRRSFAAPGFWHWPPSTETRNMIVILLKAVAKQISLLSLWSRDPVEKEGWVVDDLVAHFWNLRIRNCCVSGPHWDFYCWTWRSIGMVFGLPQCFVVAIESFAHLSGVTFLNVSYCDMLLCDSSCVDDFAGVYIFYYCTQQDWVRWHNGTIWFDFLLPITSRVSEDIPDALGSVHLNGVGVAVKDYQIICSIIYACFCCRWLEQIWNISWKTATESKLTQLKQYSTLELTIVIILNIFLLLHSSVGVTVGDLWA